MSEKEDFKEILDYLKKNRKILALSIAFFALVAVLHQGLILQQTFDLDNRPWLKISKIEYLFLFADKNILTIINYSGTNLECQFNSKNYLSDECVNLIIDKFNSRIGVTKTITTFFITNTGNSPAKLKNANINIDNKPIFELGESRDIFPKEEIILHNDFSDPGINISLTRLNYVGSLKYSHLKKLIITPPNFQTNFHSDLIIENRKLDENLESTLKFNIVHQIIE